MKKLEERLRDENYSLKTKMIELEELKDSEIHHLTITIEKLVFEKKNLEGDMEELEEKLNEIDLMNQERRKLYSEACERVKGLEEILERKEKTIEQLIDEYKAKDENRVVETEHWKKQAENLIRSLQSTIRDNAQKLTSFDKTKNEKASVSPVSVNNLSNQLEEALVREKNMRGAINNIIETESKNIAKRLKAHKNAQMTMREETEKWIMRNEEIEQRLYEMIQKCEKLLR